MGETPATFVTTPIYYPNDVPHLGTAYPTIAADILARWSRLCGKETFFLTGTDEHGKKIETVARKRRMEPKAFVDGLASEFKQAFSDLGICYDRFIRTTDRDHERVVRDILGKVYDGGDIYKGVYEGLYCVDCEAYYTSDDLRDGKCALHFKPVERLREPCYFFRLARYRDWLLEFYGSRPDFILPPQRRNEVVSFVESGLEDLCISRSTFKWGIPVPFDEGHITYVWFDALLNYITGAGYGTDPAMFDRLWPVVTHIIGKDIIRFHAVIWPAMLRSAGLAPPRRIFAHGFWTVNGRKFSKSLGNVILPSFLIETYGLDPLRYYMFRENSFGGDGDFSETNLVQRNNSELAQGLGNVVQRTISMVAKYCDSKIPGSGTVEGLDRTLRDAGADTVRQVAAAIEEFAFNRALEAIWGLIRALNVYANACAPWTLALSPQKTDRLNTVLAHLCEGLRFLSSLVSPFIPATGDAIAARLGCESIPTAESLIWGNLLQGLRVCEGAPLFRILPVPEERVPPPVGHSAEPSVLALGISYCVAQIEGVKVRREAKALEERKREVERRIRLMGRTWADAIPEARGYHHLYERLGHRSGEILSPIDSLSSYIFASELGHIPQINVIVDLYNVWTLKRFLSIGAHDREKIQGAIRLDLAQERRPYLPLGGTTPVDVLPGEYYWRDDAQVLCRLDVKQGEGTKVDEFTRHVVLIVQGNAAISSETVRKETVALCEEIVSLCGGRFKIVDGVS